MSSVRNSWAVEKSSSRTEAEEPIPKRRDRTFPLFAVEAPMAQNELLTPAEVAAMFRVNPKTVTRWARAGKISAVRTLGGHRRFRADEIRRFLEEVQDLPV
jgi:excisionase family DNA binding protein